jgi:ABC-2 type transport system ATP-binding protein
MPPVLQADSLTKRFGPLTAVDQLSLSVEEGELFGFLGPNGAGKSTSIALLCGLLRADSGRVLLRGHEVRAGERDALTRVGLCPQQVVVWHKLTCREQLVHLAEMYDVPSPQARRQADELLAAVQLTEKANALAGTLSGGMQRRLNILLALVHDPEIIVLDEPEAGLDPQSRLLVRDYIRALARRRTVILTTHDMDEAERLCDRVAIIDHGKLLALDTVEALRRADGEGRALELDFPSEAQAEQAAQLLAPEVQHHSRVATQLLLSDSDLARKLPALLTRLEAAALPVGEVRLREKSLEDLFIQMTGRRLRE